MQKETRTARQAAALQYNERERTPRVLAGGSAEIADAIIEAAEQHGIPIQKDEALAAVLSTLRPGELIPPETYRLAAELITFLYESDEEWAKGHEFLEGILGSLPLSHTDD